MMMLNFELYHDDYHLLQFFPEDWSNLHICCNYAGAAIKYPMWTNFNKQRMKVFAIIVKC